MEVELAEDRVTEEDYINLLARCRDQDQELIKLKKQHVAEIQKLKAEIEKLKIENRKLLKKVTLISLYLLTIFPSNGNIFLRKKFTTKMG